MKNAKKDRRNPSHSLPRRVQERFIESKSKRLLLLICWKKLKTTWKTYAKKWAKWHRNVVKIMT